MSTCCQKSQINRTFCINYWLNVIDASNTFATDFKTLLMKYLNVDVRMMGFPRRVG